MRKVRQVQAGGVRIGGGRVTVQSMLSVPARDIPGSVEIGRAHV